MRGITLGVMSQVSFEQETILYLNNIGIHFNDTIYHSGTPQQISGQSIWYSIDRFVKTMKKVGVFDKLKAIYPMIGGTSARHKFNLKNSADSDNAFRIVWSGDIQHSPTGIKGNGTSGYGNTKLSEAAHLAVGNESFGLYNRVEYMSQSVVDMGIADFRSSNMGSHIFSNFSNTREIVSRCQLSNMMGGTTNFGDPKTGFYSLSRTDTHEFRVQKNTSIAIVTDPEISSTIDLEFLLLARNTHTSGPSNFSRDREYTYFFVGNGLSEAEMISHYNAVQQLQIDLKRAI